MFAFNSIRKFIPNNRANVSMIFALSMIPLITVAGFAIDFQLAFSKKGKVQYAVDSAVLAGARLMQTTNSKGQVRKHTRAYFNAMLANEGGGMQCETLNIDFVSEEELEADVLCYQPTTLTRIIGREKVNFSVASTATYGIGKVDVAFVFDISGSMNNSGRLSDLKVAAKEAAETLLPEPGASGDGDVRIAMASYNSMVNAGEYFEEVTGLKPRRTYTAEVTDWEEEDYEEEYTDYDYNCEWVCKRYAGNSNNCKDWDRDCEWEEVTKTRTRSRWVETTRTEEKTITSTCVFEREGIHAFNDQQPTQVSTGDLEKELDQGQYRLSTDADNDDAYFSSGYAYWDDYYDKWRTTGTDCLNVEPFELNDNSEQIERYIDGLYANGGTAGHQGIEWGWYLISEHWDDVFDGKAAPLPYDEPDSAKAMIIMTDGEFNSQFHNSQGNSDQQARDLCDAIKDEGIIIYTVAFDAPKKGEEVLEYCASGVEFSFRASNGQELLDSYQAIASSISDLRIKF